MPEAYNERRRFPRTTVAGGHELKVPLLMTVQLLDISSTGVLIAVPQPLEPGSRAQLQTRLGTDPVHMEVVVTRVAPEGAPGKTSGRYRVGATMVSVDEACRRAVRRFLRDEES